MNKASLLLFSLSSSLIASSVLAQSSWTDMGEYWGNPFPPRWISHKMITLTNCKIQSESPKVKRCGAGSLGLGKGRHIVNAIIVPTELVKFISISMKLI